MTDPSSLRVFDATEIILQGINSQGSENIKSLYNNAPTSTHKLYLDLDVIKNTDNVVIGVRLLDRLNALA